jgi:hypothetical protein
MLGKILYHLGSLSLSFICSTNDTGVSKVECDKKYLIHLNKHPTSFTCVDIVPIVSEDV